MDPARIRALLDAVAAGGTSVEAALGELKDLPFADLGFANVDHHRALRHGAPEVILGHGKTPEQIVGIARDTIDGNPRETPDRMVYIPLAQVVGKHGEGIQDSFASTILLRTAGDPKAVIGQLRGAIASLDPNLPILEVRTMQDQLETFVSQQVLVSRLTAIFAALAVVLAAIGLYGVMSFNVARRSNEIGIRIALGASGGGVQWMVLRESLTLLATGLVLGIPVALAAARLIRAQLYEMSPFDPLIFLGATAGIAVVTLFAAWLPASRAAAVDPMTALRCE